MATTFRVEGLRDLLRVTDQLEKDVRLGVRNELRKVAEPARDQANALFLSRVSPVARQTRYGITVRNTGMVEVEQRVKGRGKHGPKSVKRPNFSVLQWERVLDPVSVDASARMEKAMGDVLDRLERKWLIGR